MGWGQAPCDTNELIVGTYNMALNGIDLGSTTGGVSIVKNAEYNEVRNDQSCLLQAIHETQQDWEINVTMRSLPAGFMRILYNMPQNVAGGNTLNTGLAANSTDPNPTDASVCFGQDLSTGGCTFPNEYCLTICGPGPNCAVRTWHFPRVVITPASLEYAIQKQNPVELEVQFRALGGCGGIVGCLRDVMDVSTVTAATVPVAVAVYDESDRVSTIQELNMDLVAAGTTFPATDGFGTCPADTQP
jgi:hypothetical protein